jgi:5'/3'-nucleotidase SurE
MGARHVIKDRPPNLVLSGVNRGRNAGEDVIYSGTVAGAVEGTILGIPSVALSQAYKSRSSQPPHWETAIRFRTRYHPARARQPGYRATCSSTSIFPTARPERSRASR